MSGSHTVRTHPIAATDQEDSEAECWRQGLGAVEVVDKTNGLSAICEVAREVPHLAGDESSGWSGRCDVRELCWMGVTAAEGSAPVDSRRVVAPLNNPRRERTDADH